MSFLTRGEPHFVFMTKKFVLSYQISTDGLWNDDGKILPWFWHDKVAMRHYGYGGICFKLGSVMIYFMIEKNKA